MRRSDREIKDRAEILRVMEKCEVMRLALHDEEYPYLVPVNFGMEVTEDGTVLLYIHSAKTGKKLELIEKDNRVSFEMDCETRLVPEVQKKNCTMAYESVIGRGRIDILPEEEKKRALDILMKHYHQEEFEYNLAVIPHTTVLRLTVESLTGKANHKP